MAELDVSAGAGCPEGRARTDAGRREAVDAMMAVRYQGSAHRTHQVKRVDVGTTGHAGVRAYYCCSWCPVLFYSVASVPAHLLSLHDRVKGTGVSSHPTLGPVRGDTACKETHNWLHAGGQMWPQRLQAQHTRVCGGRDPKSVPEDLYGWSSLVGRCENDVNARYRQRRRQRS